MVTHKVALVSCIIRQAPPSMCNLMKLELESPEGPRGGGGSQTISQTLKIAPSLTRLVWPTQHHLHTRITLIIS